MTLIEGLTAANAALNLVKELREIDKSVDEAAFKMKIAEITLALADSKTALSDAKLELNEKDEKIQKLTQEVTALRSGELCPKCRKGRLQLQETRPHQMYGLDQFGAEKWNYRCDNGECGFEQERIHDPHGAVAKRAAKN